MESATSDKNIYYNIYSVCWKWNWAKQQINEDDDQKKMKWYCWCMWPPISEHWKANQVNKGLLNVKYNNIAWNKNLTNTNTVLSSFDHTIDFSCIYICRVLTTRESNCSLYLVYLVYCTYTEIANDVLSIRIYFTLVENTFTYCHKISYMEW